VADCTGTGQGIYAAWFTDCLVLSGCEQTDWLFLAWSSDYFSGWLFRCRAVNWCWLIDLLHTVISRCLTVQIVLSRCTRRYLVAVVLSRNGGNTANCTA
jgi:hypothetical protein